MQPIYNPSLGFYAIRLGLHICSFIHLYSYDLNILDPNKEYRKGWTLVKDNAHDFIMERKTIPHIFKNVITKSLTNLFHISSYKIISNHPT